jgi:hypothetical protein
VAPLLWLTNVNRRKKTKYSLWGSVHGLFVEWLDIYEDQVKLYDWTETMYYHDCLERLVRSKSSWQ